MAKLGYPTLYDELGRVYINGRFYYQPRGVWWTVTEEGVTHTLSEKNKYGSFPYSTKVADWGKTAQLSDDEARWKTLEYTPELVDYI